MRRCLLLLALLMPVLSLAAVPTTLRVVDLRWITGEPELETWLGSLQGTLNRQEDSTAIFLVENDADDALARMLAQTYHVQVETFTPGALLASVKGSLTGQVLYTPAQPWTRNIALTAAAAAPGMVIATEKDLGLPTVADLRDRWQDRRAAYAWAADEYGHRALLLAPESGHLLADLVASRRLLALDLSPADAGESAELTALLGRLPAGSTIIGSADERAGEGDAAFVALTELLRGGGHTLIPARQTPNLSCFARFPATRPLLQGREEFIPEEGRDALVLIYDGGSALIDGSQSLDYATNFLPQLLADPAMADLPVGVQAPASLLTYAPAVYQSLVARQRFTAAELIAAPNGEGWALPMLMPDARAYLTRAAELARKADLTVVSLFDLGNLEAYQRTLGEMARLNWRGAVTRPAPVESLPDQQRRSDLTRPGFTALVGAGRVTSPDELRAALDALQGPFQVLYLDPQGIPPSTLRLLLPEISRVRTLLTPSQAFRALEEYAVVMPWLRQKQQQGIKSPRRNPPTLQVSPPVCGVAPAAGMPLPLTVRVTGRAPVLAARLIYQLPDGRLGAAELRDREDGVWTAMLPPMLVGGTVTVRARVVEQEGYGVTISDPLTLQIPTVDTDRDGLDDTAEAYLGSDPQRADTDGDGLPDGLDGDPAIVNRDIPGFFAPILPPADASFLADAGASTTDEEARSIPAGTAVAYRIPLTDLPASRATLRLVTQGAGRVALNDGEARALETAPEQPAITDLPLSALSPLGKALSVRITAGEKPLQLLSLELIANPDGPYGLTPRLTPDYPAAGQPIPVEVIAYSPQGVKAARVRYSAGSGGLSTIELKPVAGSGNTLFSGEIPAQANGTVLVYGAEAEDAAGHLAAGPFAMTPVGLARKHSVALLGGRDLRGDWQPAPIWGDTGRMLDDGKAEDHHLFLARPGAYYVWVQAQPRVRGVAVSVEERNPYTKSVISRLSHTVKGGSPDGWYKLGSFTMKESARLHVTVTPVGDHGYCAYGTVVLTQDEKFTPPLAHAALDWYNSITLSGISEGQTVSGKVTVNVQATGNLDAISVTADQVGGSISTTKTYRFTKQADGNYTLDTRGLLPGNYLITAAGYRLTQEPKGPRADTLVSASLRITIR